MPQELPCAKSAQACRTLPRSVPALWPAPRAQSTANPTNSAQFPANTCAPRHKLFRSQFTINCATRINTGDRQYNCSTWNNFAEWNSAGIPANSAQTAVANHTLFHVEQFLRLKAAFAWTASPSARIPKPRRNPTDRRRNGAIHLGRIFARALPLQHIDLNQMHRVHIRIP